MKELLYSILPLVGGALAFFFLGTSLGKKKANKAINIYKAQAEEEIRKANNRAGKAEAQARTAEKESAIAKTAAKATASKPSVQKVVSGGTREEVLSAIGDIIDESRRASK